MKEETGPLPWSLCDNSSSRVIPRSPPFLVADDEESRTGLKILRARFLSRDCGIGMTAYAGLSHRLKTVTGVQDGIHALFSLGERVSANLSGRQVRGLLGHRVMELSEA